MASTEPAERHHQRLAPMQPAPEASRLRTWLKLGVEAFSVLASLAFLVAVTLNQILFSLWGLSFLQIASPSDVVMAGLGALFYASPLVVLTATGAILGFASRRVRLLWWGLLLFECALASVLFGVSANTEGLPAGLTILLILALLPLAHLLTHRRRQEVMSRRGAAVAVAVLFSAGVLSMVVDQVRTQSRDGVNGRRVHLVQPSMPGCHGLLLWQGERASVIECGYGPKVRKNVRVIYNAEDLVVTTAETPHEAGPGRPSR